MILPLLCGGALVFVTWACRRVTRPLPDPMGGEYRDALGRQYGRLSEVELERLIRQGH